MKKAVSKLRSASAELRERMRRGSFDFDDRIQLQDLYSDEYSEDSRTIYAADPSSFADDGAAATGNDNEEPIIRPTENEDSSTGESASNQERDLHVEPAREPTDDASTEVSAAPDQRAMVATRRVRQKAIAGFIAIVLGTISLILIFKLDPSKQSIFPFKHGVIIDAGSAYSQAHLYKWLDSKYKGTGNVSQVAQCTFTGGIASLPDPAVIISCVENVTGFIPYGEKAKTSLYLAATAGMRFLNLTQPELVKLKMLELKNALHELQMNVKSISLISGCDEALYAWITVNSLMEILTRNPMLENSDYLIHTYGTLDMGGSSTQVAFSVDPSKTYISGQIFPVELYGRKYRVFSGENLCFGVMQAYNRHQALLIENLSSLEIIEDPCLPAGEDIIINAESLLGGPCTITEEFKSWLAFAKNRAKNFTFTGTSNYERCYQLVEKVIDTASCEDKGYKMCASKIDIPNKKMKFMAFSSFYYVTRFFNSTNITLPEFKQVVKHWCSLTWIDISHFPRDLKVLDHLEQYCFGAIYVQKWLADIYGFNEDSWGNLMFQQEVNGTEIGWPLGFMINATNAIPSQEPVGPTVFSFIMTLLSMFSLFLLGMGVVLMYEFCFGPPRPL